MNSSEIKNIGAQLRVKNAATGTALAGGGGNNVLVNSAYIDRQDGNPAVYGSCKLVIAYTTTLAAAQTLKFAVQPQDATDAIGTGVANTLTAFPSTTVRSGLVTNFVGEVELDFNLISARRFMRFGITPLLSAGAADTVSWTAVLVLGGTTRVPVTQSLVAG
jgi:hypothetical protein